MESGGAVEGASRLQTVPFGAAATDALWATIGAAKAGDPLAPVTVIVPGNLTGLALRRELGGRGDGLFNVRFFVLDRLAELLGAGVLAAEGRVPLDDAVKAALVRKVLADEPAPLSRVAKAANTELAVVEMLDELSASAPDAIDRLRATGRRGTQLAAIADRFHALAAPSYYDTHDVSLSAATVVRGGAAELRDIGQVVLHLPHRLTHAQLDLVDALAANGRLWALVGFTGEADADTDAIALAGRLEAVLGPVVEASPSQPERTTTTRVVAPDALGEVREAMRIVATELDAGRPLHRVAIVSRQREPYGRLLDEELAAAGIPMHGPSPRTLAQSVTGRTLLAALRLADDDFERRAVIELMSSAPIRFEGTRVPASWWARIALRAGVVRGPDQWTDRLGRRVVDEDQAAVLLAFVGWLVGQCSADARPSWAHWADWARAFLDATLGSVAARRHWPEAELAAHDAVERAIEDLRPLVAVEPGAVARSRVRAQLESALDAPAGRRGRFGVGVLCGSLAHVVGVDVDVLIVLGMAEGELPPTGVRSSVLTDVDRTAIGSRFAPATRAHDERRTFLAAVASGGTRWLLTPRVGPDRIAHPAPWWLETSHERDLAIASLDSELDEPRGAAASRHERDLRVLRACPRPELATEPLVVSQHQLARGLDALVARAGDQFSEWNGDVGPHPELEISGSRLSATSLESWAQCPARYFFRNVLHVREQDDSTEVDELEARHRGTLVHRILEELGKAHLLERPHADQLGLFPSWTVSAREIVEEVTDAVLDEFEGLGGAPYPILWAVERKRILRDVMRTLDNDPHGVILLAVEHRFGNPDKGEPTFTLVLPSGRTLDFRGSIDRVDRLHDGLRVIDYKTGSPSKEAEVREGIATGVLLQLPLYGLAAQQHFDPDAPVSAAYWYISAKGKWEQVTIPIDETLQGEFFETLDTITTGIADGVFPANPGPEGYLTFDHCQWCDFQRICPPDRDRAWARIVDAPRLRQYVELTEAVSVGEGGDG